MMTIARKPAPIDDPFNDPDQWGPALNSQPLSATEVQRYQDEIDSIVGTGRDGKSIAVLAWNGDKRYWRQICLEFHTDGSPVEFIKRPMVLYRSVYHDTTRKLLYDIGPPRWLILTRIEPEQYVPGWSRDSKVWMPDRQQYVQVKPETPPDEWFVWWMTIAEHDEFCCGQAKDERRKCYGTYAGPGRGIEELKIATQALEGKQLDNSPFQDLDRLTQKLREREVNDYVEQTMRTYDVQVSRLIDSIPYAAVRQELKDDLRRDIDDAFKQGV